jgi:hypothetical protein
MVSGDCGEVSLVVGAPVGREGLCLGWENV